MNESPLETNRAEYLRAFGETEKARQNLEVAREALKRAELAFADSLKTIEEIIAEGNRFNLFFEDPALRVEVYTQFKKDLREMKKRASRDEKFAEAEEAERLYLQIEKQEDLDPDILPTSIREQLEKDAPPDQLRVALNRAKYMIWVLQVPEKYVVGGTLNSLSRRGKKMITPEAVKRWKQDLGAETVR